MLKIQTPWPYPRLSDPDSQRVELENLPLKFINLANSDPDAYFSLRATVQIQLSSQLITDYHIVSYEF